MSKKGIDLTTHWRNPKTGAVVKETPYRLKVIDQVSYFEKPKGSGKVYYADGSAVPEKIAATLGFTPVVHEASLEDKLVDAEQRIAALEAELAAKAVKVSKSAVKEAAKHG